MKPAPESDAPLTVTAVVPVEDKVSDWLADELTSTLPKSTLLVFTVSAEVIASNCRAKVSDELPALAVNVAVCAVVTAATSALKSTLAAPAATVTEAGTVTAVSLLARFTINPLLPAAALRVTVQLSVVDPVTDPFAQLNALREAVTAAVPVPLRLT